ncbi:hypothetical protein SUDANB96_00568 [Streptomyces sp. enrichment culture]
MTLVPPSLDPAPGSPAPLSDLVARDAREFGVTRAPAAGP